MKTVRLGSTGLEVAELGFGAMYLPRIPAEQSDILIRQALDQGVSYFDTASAYMASEEKLGRVLRRYEKKFVVASRSINYKSGLAAFRSDFEQSFKRLQLPVIDFYGFHAVNQPHELDCAMGEPLEFLKEQKACGRIRHIAITSHNHRVLEQALTTGQFEMAMFPFNVIEREPLLGVLRKAADRGIATSVMKPLAGGVIGNKELALRFFFDYEAGVIAPGMMSQAELSHNTGIFKSRRPLSKPELQDLEQSVAALGKDFCRRCSYCMPCPQGIMIPFMHMLQAKLGQNLAADDRQYTLELGRRNLQAIESCTACGSCVEKCPYGIATPDRIRELVKMVKPA